MKHQTLSFNFFIVSVGLFFGLNSNAISDFSPNRSDLKNKSVIFGSKINKVKVKELLKNAKKNKAVKIAVSANIKTETDGPGRSGGGNGTFGQAKLLDQNETISNIPILDWEKIQIFQKLKNKLSKYPELQAYLTEAFSRKQWYLTNQQINIKGCLNATLNGVNDSSLVIACQWENRGLINQNYFDALKMDDEKLQLLIHEGLVHHMVVSLNRLQKLSSVAHVDQQQESMEFFIHKISERILRLDFKNIYELNDDLKLHGFPVMITKTDYEEIASQFYGLRLQDIFVGAKERTDLMEKVYLKSVAVDMSSLFKNYGSKACFIKADGYSVPGFYSGGMISIDEFFPSAQFALFPFKSHQEDEELIRHGIEQVFRETGVNIPLSFENSNWSGSVDVDVRQKFEVALRNLKDPDLIQKMEDFLKKQLGANGLSLHQKIRLSIRSVKTTSASEYVIFKREVVTSEKPNEVIIDYVSGKLIPFPECLESFQ